MFYKEYMEKHKPKIPYQICGSWLKGLLGIVSPSLYWIVVTGGKGEKATKEVKEWEVKKAKYLCYKRTLNKEGWKALYRELRKRRRVRQ